MKITPIVADSASCLTLELGKIPTACLEHTPVEAYFVLRLLAQASIETRALFGSRNEGTVQFLISRGLAVEELGLLSITYAGRAIGEIPDDSNGPQTT
jgi:hypothetical protein